MEAEKVKNKLLNLKNEYGTLTFDGGKFNGKHYFVGILYFPFKVNSSLFLCCFKESISTQEQMAETCAETLNNLNSVNVTNIVTDGLLFQVEATQIFPVHSGPNI
jgi:hypothetical protein